MDCRGSAHLESEGEGEGEVKCAKRKRLHSESGLNKDTETVVRRKGCEIWGHHVANRWHEPSVTSMGRARVDVCGILLVETVA